MAKRRSFFSPIKLPGGVEQGARTPLSQRYRDALKVLQTNSFSDTLRIMRGRGARLTTEEAKALAGADRLLTPAGRGKESTKLRKPVQGLIAGTAPAFGPVRGAKIATQTASKARQLLTRVSRRQAVGTGSRTTATRGGEGAVGGARGSLTGAGRAPGVGATGARAKAGVKPTPKPKPVEVVPTQVAALESVVARGAAPATKGFQRVKQVLGGKTPRRALMGLFAADILDSLLGRPVGSRIAKTVTGVDVGSAEEEATRLDEAAQDKAERALTERRRLGLALGSGLSALERITRSEQERILDRFKIQAGGIDLEDRPDADNMLKVLTTATTGKGPSVMEMLSPATGVQEEAIELLTGLGEQDLVPATSESVVPELE